MRYFPVNHIHNAIHQPCLNTKMQARVFNLSLMHHAASMNDITNDQRTPAAVWSGAACSNHVLHHVAETSVLEHLEFHYSTPSLSLSLSLPHISLHFKGKLTSVRDNIKQITIQHIIARCHRIIVGYRAKF